MLICRDLAHFLMSVLYKRDQSPREVLPGDTSETQIKGEFRISSKIKSLHFASKYRKVSGLFVEITVLAVWLKVSLAVPRHAAMVRVTHSPGEPPRGKLLIRFVSWSWKDVSLS